MNCFLARMVLDAIETHWEKNHPSMTGIVVDGGLLMMRRDGMMGVDGWLGSFGRQWGLSVGNRQVGRFYPFWHLYTHIKSDNNGYSLSDVSPMLTLFGFLSTCLVVARILPLPLTLTRFCSFKRKSLFRLVPIL